MNLYNKKNGFTLIELMIVVAIIGMLAAIAIPRFAQMVERSREAATKGNIGALRSAIFIYYVDNEGRFPRNLRNQFRPYLFPIPPAKATPLGNRSTVTNVTGVPNRTTTRGWAYCSVPAGSQGSIWCRSTAKDTRKQSFTTY